jgi:hypothetical protein
MMERNTSGRRFLLLVITTILTACHSPKEKMPPEIEAKLAMLPFIKADSVNPVLLPRRKYFYMPNLKKTIKWEEKDVFNPAANGKVYLLFRAAIKLENLLVRHPSD